MARALETWVGDGKWVYAPADPFDAGDVSNSKFLQVTSGTGWTPGFYAILQFIDLGAPLLMLRLDSAPAAAGTAGGTGEIFEGAGADFLYIAEGDSITDGNGVAPYTAYVMKDKGANWHIINSGVGGATLGDMISQYAVAIALNYDPTKILNVSSENGGTNDGFTLGSTTAEVLTRKEDLGELFHATGFFPHFTATIMLRTPSGAASPDFATWSGIINTALRAAFNVATGNPYVFAAAPGTTWADYLIDVAALPEAADPTNLTYFADGVHPTQLLQSIIGQLYSDAISESLSAPEITDQPDSAAKNLGADVTFTVVATGVPTPTYQWEKDGVEIGGEVSSSLTIEDIEAGDAGSYTCVVTNSEGSVESSSAVLTVNAARRRRVIRVSGRVLVLATA